MNILSDNLNFKCNVSSVSNKDVKQHGKQFMFDQRNDTSWCSDHGTPQWIAFTFKELVNISSIKIQFQGGFAGKNCQINFVDDTGNLVCEESLYPDDINSEQEFIMKSKIENIRKLKLIFESSTDFFGRIIIYNLEIIS